MSGAIRAEFGDDTILIITGDHTKKHDVLLLESDKVIGINVNFSSGPSRPPLVKVMPAVVLEIPRDPKNLVDSRYRIRVTSFTPGPAGTTMQGTATAVIEQL